MNTKDIQETETASQIKNIMDEIKELKKSVGKDGEKFAKNVKDSAEDWASSSVDYVKKNPEWTALSVFGIGLLLGLLFTRKS